MDQGIDLKELYNLVYDFPYKSAWGFNSEEIEELLKQFPNCNREKFDKAMRGNTCMREEGKIISYPCDVFKALRCGLEQRDLKSWEWD